MVGGYTTFRINGPCPKASIDPDEKAYPPSVDITHPNLPDGGAFLVWTEGGCISFLEYYSNTNVPWPRDDDDGVTGFTFSSRN